MSVLHHRSMTPELKKCKLVKNCRVSWCSSFVQCWDVHILSSSGWTGVSLITSLQNTHQKKHRNTVILVDRLHQVLDTSKARVIWIDKKPREEEKNYWNDMDEGNILALSTFLFLHLVLYFTSFHFHLSTYLHSM